VGVPILVFVLCLGGGAVAAGQWLPDIEAGVTGGLAFFVVCGLLGLALALFGMHIYLIVHELNHLAFGPGGLTKAEVVGDGLRDIAFEDGAVLGLAFAVFLLAPPVTDYSEHVEDSSEQAGASQA
jgi:hypothetical protein